MTLVASLQVSQRPIQPRYIAAIGLYRLNCTAVFAFGRSHGPHGPTGCQPLTYTALAAPQTSNLADHATLMAPLLVSLRPTAPAARQPSASTDPTAVVVLLLVSLWPVWLQQPGNFISGRPHRPRGPASCQTPVYTALAQAQPSTSAYPTAFVAPLVVRLRPVQP